MIWAKLALITILSNCLLAFADELAFSDVDSNGKMQYRFLTDVETARGADSFFLADPMDSHDYTDLSALRKSLFAQMKTAGVSSSKVALLEEALRPIYVAMPKDSEGRLNNGTVRYALHRFFGKRQGWSIKGLQPAGAAWMLSEIVSDDVKHISKFMAPSYLQDLILDQLGVSSFDLRSLAIIAATLEHLIHADMIHLVYSVYTALELPIPGKRDERQVEDILDTFMMVFAFGLNLDVSNLGDVRVAKRHLDLSHPGWPQLQAFAQQVRRSIFVTGELDFDGIVRVVESIGEKYGEFQGKECSRTKEDLLANSSSTGKVKLSKTVSHFQRDLDAEDQNSLQRLGALDRKDLTWCAGEKTWCPSSEGELIIPNYINSQSMCLSTASFYAACCVNECEGLLAELEGKVRTPAAKPEDLVSSLANMPGWKHLVKDAFLLEELHSLKDHGTGLIQIHSRRFAQWMHNQFPLQCPAPDMTHDQKATNPKTPDEWMELPRDVEEFQEMHRQISDTLSVYTTMGTKDTFKMSSTKEPAYHSAADVVRIRARVRRQGQQGVVPLAVHSAAVVSMIVVSMAFIRKGFHGLHCWRQTFKQKLVRQDVSSKDVV